MSSFPTLGSLAAEVQLNLGNRSDIASRVNGWLADAYIDLGSALPFPTLEITLNDQFTQGIDIANYPADLRAVKTITLQTTVSGSNTVRIWRRDIRVIRRYSLAQGQPAIYAPYGLGIIVRPVPDRQYQFIWDYWQQPQITTDQISTNILLPQDWIEILKLSATLRGHIGLFERDKAGELRQLLFGDPKHPEENPGLIKQKLLQRTAENVDSEFSIRPRIRRFTSTI